MLHNRNSASILASGSLVEIDYPFIDLVPLAPEYLLHSVVRRVTTEGMYVTEGRCALFP